MGGPRGPQKKNRIQKFGVVRLRYRASLELFFFFFFCFLPFFFFFFFFFLVGGGGGGWNVRNICSGNICWKYVWYLCYPMVPYCTIWYHKGTAWYHNCTIMVGTIWYQLVPFGTVYGTCTIWYHMVPLW